MYFIGKHVKNKWVQFLIFFYSFYWLELSHCSSAEDDNKIIVYQNVWCTCGYCFGHLPFVFLTMLLLSLTCCVMFEKFIGIELLMWLLAFSVILVMFIFLAFLDTIYKVMFVLQCMRKQKNGCVLLDEGSLWEAVLPILLTWYCYTINRNYIRR